MRQKIFLALEKLKITRGERRSVAVLMVLLLSLAGVNMALKPSSPFKKPFYHKLTSAFHHRTAMLKKREQKLMQRYHPALHPAALDSIPADTNIVVASPKKKASHPHKSSVSQININTADAQTLQKIPGVGPAYSHRIVAYRQKNGPFQSVDELIKIKGIGKKRLEKLKPFVKLKE